MPTARHFIALHLPSALCDALTALQGSWDDDELRAGHGARAAPRARRIKSAQMHITLVFLGESGLSPHQLAEVVDTEAARIGELRLALGGLAAFPSVNLARTLVANVVGADLARLHSLQDSLRRTLQINDKYPDYLPHVTLARFRPDADVTAWVNTADNSAPWQRPFSVPSIRLYSSELSADGGRYTTLHEATL